MKLIRNLKSYIEMTKKVNNFKFEYLSKNDQKHLKDSTEHNKKLMESLSKL